MKYSNHKKELGMALQEMKQADWFKELDKETQEEAIKQTKACYTPPDDMENTLLNMHLSYSGRHPLRDFLEKILHQMNRKPKNKLYNDIRFCLSWAVLRLYKPSKNWVEWEKYCAENFPWADPVMGNAQVKLHKRDFFTQVHIK